MYNTNITNARANLYNLVNMAIDDSEVININTKNGNALLISEDDYNSLLETIYITQDKKTMNAIKESKENINNDDYWVDESEVNWDV
ncbi:MAG: type II toxin-antitoxin system Phd/YefM family antitoxin [Acutalibacteraceae bacterium]